MPSMKRYLEDRKDGQGAHWPGTADGYPFRGPAPDLRDDEYQDLRLGFDYHSERFCLWDPTEHSRFNEIMDRIVNGRFVEYKRYDRWSDQHAGLIVWLEWTEVYGLPPERPGATNGQTIQQSPGSQWPATSQSYDIPAN